MKTDKIKKEIEELCKKNNIEIRYKFDFPIYKIIPDEVKLAMKIMDKYGLVVRLELKENK